MGRDDGIEMRGAGIEARGENAGKLRAGGVVEALSILASRHCALVPWLRDQEAGIRSQGSGVRGQESGIRSQGSVPAPS